MQVEKLSLGVFEQNPQAINCYQACGCKQMSNAPREIFQCMGSNGHLSIWRSITLRWMPSFKKQKLQVVKQISVQTMQQIYPKYYPKGAVAFFLEHHNDTSTQADIQAGNVYLLYHKDIAVGTFTV